MSHAHLSRIGCVSLLTGRQFRAKMYRANAAPPSKPACEVAAWLMPHLLPFFFTQVGLVSFDFPHFSPCFSTQVGHSSCNLPHFSQLFRTLVGLFQCMLPYFSLVFPIPVGFYSEFCPTFYHSSCSGGAHSFSASQIIPLHTCFSATNSNFVPSTY